ncbi:GH12 family glycosyl hydrolase domain-containing protein [Vibrio quintilis]|nr:glycosyl hydrolase [Vibrio quintilis]
MVVLFLSALTFYVNAANWSSCDRQGTYINNEYNIYNNIWGEGAGTQCLWVNSAKNWGVWAKHPHSHGVKAYPHVSSEQSIEVNSLRSCRSEFDVQVPKRGDYVVSYDLLYDNHSFEVMLWMNYNGDVAPISYSYNSQGMAIPDVYHLHLGGHTWNVYRGTNGVNEVFTFVRTQKIAAEKVDIVAISKWLKKEDWFGNASLQSIRFGFEITSSSVGSDFIVRDYSLSCN